MDRWDPFEGINSLRREINRVVEDFLEGGSRPAREPGTMRPIVEVSETPEAIVVKAQVPGVKKEDLHLQVADDTLTLKGELKEADKKPEEVLYQREFRYGRFSRTLSLPTTVQAENAAARLKDGILVVTFPKSETAQAQEIAIATEG